MDHQVVVTFHYQQQEVFVKIVKFYSRHIPRQLQRLIEFVVLCAAISSLCLLLYAHAVVKHLPKRCVDASVAQRSSLLSEVDILRVDLAHDASLDYSLNDSYAKEFSLFGFYNALFDTDANEDDSEGEGDEEDDAEDTAAAESEDDFDVFVQDRNAEESDTGRTAQNSSESVEHKTAKVHNGVKQRTRAERSGASSSHFDERHPTDSLFANLCSSLYLMVTGGLARSTSTWPRHRAAKTAAQSNKASREVHTSANFIRQLARHFPPAAFAVVGGDALFASANNDRFIMEFSRELGFLKLSADVRSRLGLRTALWYFVAPQPQPQPVQNDNHVPSPSVSTPTPKFRMVSKASLNAESQANVSNMRCEADRSERATPLSAVKSGFAWRVDDDIVRFDSGVCFGNQFDRFLFDYAFGYDDYLIGIVKRYAELLNVSHGFVRNVMNGEYYRYRTGGMARGGLRGASRVETVLRCALAMCGFTWLVSTLLRHSHEQIFALIVALLRHLETNWTLVLPASPLFVIVLGLLGAQVLLATVFRTDSPTAFFLLVAVWFADHFYALVSTGPGPHARTARVYFARFFYAYQLAFYVHYALESGLFAGLALVTYALFLLHAAIYLFHHHHLPLARAARARARRLRRSERHRQPTPESNPNPNSNAEAEVEPEPEPGADVQNDGPTVSADIQVPSEPHERPAADADNPLG